MCFEQVRIRDTLKGLQVKGKSAIDLSNVLVLKHWWDYKIKKTDNKENFSYT
jgi:hypothetical protein